MNYVFKKKRYRLLMPVFDILGAVISFPFRIFKKNIPRDPKKILVVRLDHIGDFVCTTPLLGNLKRHFPGAKITVLINSVSKELAYRDPNIDKVITFSPFYLARGDKSSTLKGLLRVVKDVRNIGFDLGVEPRGDLLSILIMWVGGVKYRVGYGITGGGFLLNKACKYDRSKHVIERNLTILKALDISVTNKSPEVYFNEKDEEVVERLIREKWDSPRRFASQNEARGQALFFQAIILHPFAGAKAKEWPIKNFQELIDRLKKDGYDIMLVGSKDDEGSFTNVIDMRGRLNLPQLACLIKRIGFFIGLDSGPANIAAALNVPSIIICSGTNIPQLWIPNNNNVKFIYKDIDCRPCENKVCPKEKHECMELITVDEVIDVLEGIASGKMGQSPSGTVPIFPRNDGL